MIERRFVADHGLHAAYAGREFRVLNVQFDIGGKLADAAVRAQIVGTQNFYPTQGGQQGLAAQFAVVRLLAARASHGALFFCGDRKFQQLA